jgi:hypothetical protein
MPPAAAFDSSSAPRRRFLETRLTAESRGKSGKPDVNQFRQLTKPGLLTG